MADPVQFDVKAFAKIVADMAGVADRLDPTMAVAAEMLVSEVHDRWESAGDGTWPALAASTLEKRRGGVAQILIDTGRGIASVHGESGGDFAEATTDVDYMRFHCGDAPRTRLPKRDPFDLAEAAMDRVLDYVTQDVADRMVDGSGLTPS